MRVSLVLLLVALAKSAQSQATPGRPAANQLQAWKNSTSRAPIHVLTTTSGRRVRSQELNTINTDLISNSIFLEELSALNRERIPARVVHAKAAGAFGYFKVTHDVSCISNVAFMSEVGKITPVVARISAAFSEKGSADTIRSPYSIAAKFYTEEGNYDFLGFSTDTFIFKDPILFPSGVHATMRNPKTHLQDVNMLFDLLSLRPESFSLALQFIGDRGVPASFRNLEVFAIHTFQVENDRREISYVRFQLTPDLGVKTLNQTEAFRLAGLNPNFSTEDLYNAIEDGDYPSWTFGWQVISKKDVKKAPFDIFDVTLRWPVEHYPVQPIGKFVLNRNPDDHHRDIEQLGLNPGNLPPGIQGLDKLWEARVWAYRDAQLYRMGPNFNNIKVNCPLSQVYTYTRDGSPPVRDTRGGAPNYFPNSFNGPVAASDTRTRTKRTKIYTDPNPTNFGQVSDYYHGLPEDSRQRLVENFSSYLSLVYPSLQARVFKALGDIDVRIKRDMEAGLAKVLAAAAAMSK